MTRPAPPDAPPGALLLHPAALGALAVMAVNDHWAKARFHDAATGKLSDVAGVFALPLVLVSLVELAGLLQAPALPFCLCSAKASWLSKDRSSRVPLAVAIAVTGLGFAATKLVAGVGTAYVVALGGLRWLALATLRLPTGEGLPAFPDVQLVADRTDLLVLPVLVLTWLVGAGGLDRSVSAMSRAGVTSR